MKHQKSDALPTRRSRATALGAAAVGLLALAGCNEAAPDDPGFDGENKIALSPFVSCEEVDDYLAEVVAEAYARNYAQGYGYRTDVDFDAGAPVGAPEGDSAAEGGAEPPASPEEFTETNVQELGVDEPDLVKTNGDYLFLVNNQVLHIIDSWPADEAHEVATFELPGYGEQMFLAGDRVVVFTSVWTGTPDYYVGGMGGGAIPPMEGDPIPEPREDGDGSEGMSADEAIPPSWEEPESEPDPFDDGTFFSGTRVTIIDVSDPTDPTAVSTFDIEGSYTSARMVDGMVYLILNSDLFSYGDSSFASALAELELPPVSWDITAAERDAIEAEVFATILPRLKQYMRDGGRDRVIPDLRTSASDRGNVYGCQNLMRPPNHAGVAILSVVAFDPSAPNVEGVGLVAGGWQVYGSKESLYVAQDSRWWFWPAVDGRYAATHIHKFSLNGGEPEYEASGEVTGWLLNQFSMSEFDGYLRVATTDTSWGGVAVDDAFVGVEGDTAVEVDAGSSEPSPKSIVELRADTTVPANNVFVLEQNRGNLDIVGGIRGIAPTESIFAVRFSGETGYVVTFRQTDPLFVVDLADPTAPTLRGELHVPGYSGYLHPMGDSHLIGIGRDGDELGRIKGVQLSVFDVSNPDNPVRTAIHTLPYGDGTYSWSDAEHDHHAFTYYASRGLLAIPVTLEDYSWSDGAYAHFSGIVVFEVTPTSIEEVGRVSHTYMASDRYCGARVGADSEPGVACDSWGYAWWVRVRRSVFMDDYLFAISDHGVTTSALDAIPDVLAEVRFY